MTFNRALEFARLSKKLRQITKASASTTIEVGIKEIGGEATKTCLHEFVTDSGLATAMRAQDVIGWSNFMLGWIAREWSISGPNEAFEKEVINYGLALWTHRNHIIHGNDRDSSKLELLCTQSLIEAMYEEISPCIHPSHTWLISSSVTKKLEEPYSVQIAWIDSMRQLYPERYKELRNIVGRNVFEADELERNKHRTTWIEE